MLIMETNRIFFIKAGIRGGRPSGTTVPSSRVRGPVGIRTALVFGFSLSKGVFNPVSSEVELCHIS